MSSLATEILTRPEENNLEHFTTQLLLSKVSLGNNDVMYNTIEEELVGEEWLLLDLSPLLHLSSLSSLRWNSAIQNVISLDSFLFQLRYGTL